MRNKTAEKIKQQQSREEAEARGTNGRQAQKGKARSSQKPYGGKMAR